MLPRSTLVGPAITSAIKATIGLLTPAEPSVILYQSPFCSQPAACGPFKRHPQRATRRIRAPMQGIVRPISGHDDAVRRSLAAARTATAYPGPTRMHHLGSTEERDLPCLINQAGRCSHSPPALA
jgi:hypothetical protein